jgi:hypothetical protein
MLEKVCPASDVLHVSYFAAFDLPLPCCKSLLLSEGRNDHDVCVLLLQHILGPGHHTYLNVSRQYWLVGDALPHILSCPRVLISVVCKAI